MHGSVSVSVSVYAIACIQGLILNATKFVANLVQFQLPRIFLCHACLCCCVLQLEGHDTSLCLITDT